MSETPGSLGSLELWMFCLPLDVHGSPPCTSEIRGALSGSRGHQLGFANSSSSFEPRVGEATPQPQWKYLSTLAHGSVGERPI